MVSPSTFQLTILHSDIAYGRSQVVLASLGGSEDGWEWSAATAMASMLSPSIMDKAFFGVLQVDGGSGSELNSKFFGSA